MPRVFPVAVICWLLAVSAVSASDRINQEGRILGPLPAVTNAILFNTTNADAVVSAMQIFPVTNPWNEDISNLPVLTNSDAMIAQIMSNLNSNRRTLIAFFEMNYVLTPDNQPLVPVDFFNYPDQSDLNGGVSPDGLYPIPTNQPIETWPVGTGTQTLYQWQTNNDGSDRHSITVQPGAGNDFETWEMLLPGTNWSASNGALFNLNTNGLRPAGWTSGDAAGLPMFPALPRYDECERGMVEHACRIVVQSSRYNTSIYPATHFAAPSGNTNVNLPAMGQRVRLKSSFVIPTSWLKEEKAVLLGLKKYGALVADNGNFFSISVTPDNRWPPNCFNNFTNISITNFEVVQSTGPTGGPRSPGAPIASAGPDQTVSLATGATLAGCVAFSNAMPTILWTEYSGPGTVAFGNPAQTNTTAAFSAPGVYTLELSAADGVHAVAYDATAITVTNGITATITLAGAGANLNWTGGSPPYVVQQANALPASSWNGVATTSLQNASVPVTNSEGYFRVQGQ
ncbi:MAG: PKD domain-containing protein [Limisphaerales bacterium]